MVLHHLPHGLFRLLHGGGHHHALAQGQAVGLDHDGGTLPADIGQGGVQIGEGLVLGGGDVILLHQGLGEGLAGLDDGGVGVRAEGGDAGGLHGVHHP